MPGLELVDASLGYRDLRAGLEGAVHSGGSLWATTQVGAAAAPGELHASLRLTYAGLGAGTAADPERVYHVARLFLDELPTGWSQTFAAWPRPRRRRPRGGADDRAPRPAAAARAARQRDAREWRRNLALDLRIP